MLTRNISLRSFTCCYRIMTRGQSSSTSLDDNDVLFEDHGKRGLIILNKPKQLNALNSSMVQKIYPKLKEWDKTKDLIVIKGCVEKAFCAGGDVVSITKDKTGNEARQYFKKEYLNNGMIASLKAPYLAIIHGIVMGGGVGLSVHGKYRVATETTLFAMPETKIGLFPDVGVGYFLSRLPDQLGMFLALTGHRLKGFDLCHIGLATHFCHSSLLPNMETELLSGDASTEDTLKKYHCDTLTKLPNSKAPDFSLAPHLETIRHCFSAGTVEEMLERLRARGDDFSLSILKSIGLMSPTSLKITVEQIHRCASFDVYEVLNQDYRMSWWLLDTPEFYEGVRALLVDKDNSPKWRKSKVQDVSNAEVLNYFKPLNSTDELNLPSSLDS